MVKKSFFVSSLKTEVRNEYTFGKSLNIGTLGQVFLATNIMTQEVRAIKQIPKARVKNAEEFATEIEVLKECDQPNIVRLYDIYEDNRFVYLVMEYCQGGNLLEFILHQKNVSERDTSRLFAQLLYAVNYLHSRNIVHRNLQPENILFLDSENTLLKVCDFAVAKIIDNSSPKMTDWIGSALTIAPEILARESYSLACDLWSCGVILYMLLGGHPPFYGKTPQAIQDKIKNGEYNFDEASWSRISESAKDLIQKLLVRDPHTRLTADQTFAHPWVASCEDLDPESIQLNVDNLMEYKESNALRRTFLLCIASKCSEAEISKLRAAFEELDVNKNGSLSVQELREGLQHVSEVLEELEPILNSMDFDHNQVVDYSEFVAALLERKKDLDEIRLFNAFNVFDVDKSGKISCENLRTVLDTEGKHDREYWDSIIAQIDKNHDGEIDYNEFLQLMVGQDFY